MSKMNVSILKLATTMLAFESCYSGPYSLQYTFDVDAANIKNNRKSFTCLKLLFFYVKVTEVYSYSIYYCTLKKLLQNEMTLYLKKNCYGMKFRYIFEIFLE